MTPTPLAVAFRTGKIIKNWLRVFERGENLLQNCILHFKKALALLVLYHFVAIFSSCKTIFNDFICTRRYR